MGLPGDAPQQDPMFMIRASFRPRFMVVDASAGLSPEKFTSYSPHAKVRVQGAADAGTVALHGGAERRDLRLGRDWRSGIVMRIAWDTMDAVTTEAR